MEIVLVYGAEELCLCLFAELEVYGFQLCWGGLGFDCGISAGRGDQPQDFRKFAGFVEEELRLDDCMLLFFRRRSLLLDILT